MKYRLRPYNNKGNVSKVWILVPNTYAIGNVWLHSLREDLRRLLTFTTLMQNHSPPKEANMNLLQRRLKDLVEQHGSIRAVGVVLQTDHAYLWRLLKGQKAHPDDSLLQKLGLRRVITYKKL